MYVDQRLLFSNHVLFCSDVGARKKKKKKEIAVVQTLIQSSLCFGEN